MCSFADVANVKGTSPFLQRRQTAQPVATLHNRQNSLEGSHLIQTVPQMSLLQRRKSTDSTNRTILKVIPQTPAQNTGLKCSQDAETPVGVE